MSQSTNSGHAFTPMTTKYSVRPMKIIKKLLGDKFGVLSADWLACSPAYLSRRRLGDDIDVKFTSTIHHLATSTSTRYDILARGHEMGDSGPAGIYSNLDYSKAEIRLLYLEPKSSSRVFISCTLRVANFNAEICEYEALSYEWGVDTDRQGQYGILLEGRLYFVRQNLHAALYHLRKEEESRVLWIDALCIDQGNIGERGHQVGLMGSIYTRATGVIAWLGSPDSSLPLADVQRAFEFVELLGLAESQRNSDCLDRSTSTMLHSPFGERVPIQFNDPRWQLLNKLLERTFWTRLWIIQELVLPSSVKIQIDWFTLELSALEYIYKEKCYTNMGTLDKAVPKLICQQRAERANLDRNLTEHTILELCYRYRESNCGDLRDKVFALLAMSDTCCQRAIAVNYNTAPMKLCEMVIEHELGSHSSHKFHEEYGNDKSIALFRMVQALFALFGDEDSSSNRAPEKYPGISFLDMAATAKPQVALLACELIGNLNLLDHQLPHRTPLRAMTSKTLFTAGETHFEGSLTSGAKKVILGDLVYSLGVGNDAIILRCLGRRLYLVGSGMCAWNRGRSMLDRVNRTWTKPQLRHLGMDILMLRKFCMYTRGGSPFTIIGTPMTQVGKGRLPR